MRTILLAMLLCLPLVADTVVVGANDGPDNANGFPFGTNGGASAGFYDPFATFQQLYGRGAFPGAVTITGISFASSSGQGGTGGIFSDVLTLSLGTAVQNVTSPDATYSGNRGADFTTVFSGPVTASLTESDSFDLSFAFTKPFTYNPAHGDLLFQVTLETPVSYTGSFLYFDAGNSGDVSEVFNPSPSASGNVNPGYGLLTQFTYTESPATAPVPEPATFMLLFASGAFFFTLRDRRLR